MATFSERLKDLRESRGMSQQTLADKLSVSRSIVGMYELDTRKPSFEMLEAIADLFNVDMDFLLGKTDIERRNPVTQYDANGIPVMLPESLTDQEKHILELYRNASQEARQYASLILESRQPNA